MKNFIRLWVILAKILRLFTEQQPFFQQFLTFSWLILWYEGQLELRSQKFVDFVLEMPKKEHRTDGCSVYIRLLFIYVFWSSYHEIAKGGPKL